MKQRTMRRAAPLALAVIVMASQAQAQDEPNAADVSAARALGQDGVKLADAGNCQEAVDKLARAEKMFHAPTTLARLGECQVQLGKLVEGTENLNRVSRETLAPNAPPAFTQAQERARKLLADTKPKIAKLKIAVAAPPDAKLSVTVDGESIPLANLNTNRPMDPGDHVVEATAPGFLKATSKVKLSEGGVDSIALTLEADPNAPKVVPLAAVPVTPGQQPPPAGEADTTSRSRTPAYVALGVGAVGIGVGVLFGALALGKKSDLDSACSNNVCPKGSQDTIDSGKTLGTVSTIGFVVGGIGVVTGVVLLVANSKSGSSSAAASNPLRIRVGSARIEPTVGLERAGLAGTF